MTSLHEAFESFSNDIAFESIKYKSCNFIESNVDFQDIETKTNIKDLHEKIDNLKAEIVDTFNECTILNTKLITMDDLCNKIDISHKTLIKASNSFDDLNLDIELENINVIYEKCKIYTKDIQDNFSKKRMLLTKLLKTSSISASLDNVRICPICLNNEIKYAYTPCGHTFCEKCITKNVSNNCYICRHECTPMKLFFC